MVSTKARSNSQHVHLFDATVGNAHPTKTNKEMHHNANKTFGFVGRALPDRTCFRFDQDDN